MSLNLVQGLASLFKKTLEPTELVGDDGETFDESKALDLVRSWLTEKVNNVTTNQHGRGLKEAHKAWETALSERAASMKIELPEDAKGTDILSAFLDKINTVSELGDGKDLNVEQIKKLKNFQTAINEVVTPIKKKYEEVEQTLTRERLSNQINFNRQYVIDSTFEALEKANWKKGETPDEQAIRKATIIDLLTLHTDGFKRVKVDKEAKKILLLNDQGEPVRDDLQNEVEVDKWILAKQPFSTHVFDPNKDSLNVKPGKQPKGGDYVFPDGATLEEALSGITDNGEKAKITKAYAEKIATK